MHATELRQATYAELVEALTAALEAQGCTGVRVERAVSMQLHGDASARVCIDILTCRQVRPRVRVNAFALLTLPTDGGSECVAAACKCDWHNQPSLNGVMLIEAERAARQRLRERGSGTEYTSDVLSIARTADALRRWVQRMSEATDGVN